MAIRFRARIVLFFTKGLTWRMPFFSIIVPTRNRVEDLRYCLAGIAAQSFTDFEVIVIDDGSSASVLESYGQMAIDLGARFRFLYPPHPCPWGSGPGAARNRGLAAAEGVYVGFCDDDDAWTARDHLSVAASALKLVSADAYFADQSSLLAGEPVKESWLPELRAWSASGAAALAEGVYRLPLEPLLACSHFPHLNISLYRRARIERMGGFWEAIRYEEDRDFFWRAMDGIGDILYRPVAIGVHNIPDPALGNNASARLQYMEKMMTAIHLINHVKANTSDPRILKRCLIAEMHSFGNLAHLVEEKMGPRASVSFVRHKLAANFRLRSVLHLVAVLIKAWAGRTGLWSPKK